MYLKAGSLVNFVWFGTSHLTSPASSFLISKRLTQISKILPMALQMCPHHMGDALCLEAMREIPGPRRHPFHVQAPLAFAIKMKHLRNNFKLQIWSTTEMRKEQPTGRVKYESWRKHLLRLSHNTDKALSAFICVMYNVLTKVSLFLYKT